MPIPTYAHQLWRYTHRTVPSGRPRRGISTVIPSDLLRVGDTLYLHAIVNRGFGNVVWTEIWSSDDSGISWRHLGDDAKFPAALHNGHAQCWSWITTRSTAGSTYVSTGFQRDKGIILRRVRSDNIARSEPLLGWGRAGGGGRGGRSDTADARRGTWGELSLADGERQVDPGGFLLSKYASGIGSLTPPPLCAVRRCRCRSSGVPETPRITLVTGCATLRRIRPRVRGSTWTAASAWS